MNMEEIESALISHRGHDASNHILHIRFRTKTGVVGSLYEYGNVSPELYAEGCAYIDDKGKVSFGQWMNRVVKANPTRFPYRQLELVGGVPVDDFFAKGKAEAKKYIDAIDVTDNDSHEATDFASGQPLPATTSEPLPENEDELIAKALELQTQAKAIIIRDVVSYSLAETVAVAIARMRDALEKTMRPKITALYTPYKAALEILNKYDKPLESDQKRLKEGMTAFKRLEDQKARAEAERIRIERQKEEDAKANERAQQLKLEDAIEAEQRGEPELAQSIMDAPALPLQAAFVAPVYVPSAVQPSKQSTHVPKWEFEWIDENGNPVDFPRLDLIPKEYIKVDDKSIGAVVRTLKNKTNIPGVRAYDAGSVRINKRDF